MPARFELTIPSVDALMARNEKTIQALRGAIRHSGVADADRKARAMTTSQDAPVRLLAKLCGPLPASEDHHDADEDGLFRHSIEASCWAIEAFRRQVDPSADGYERQLMAVALAALVHDIGKLWFMKAIAVEPDQAPGPDGETILPSWKIADGYLIDEPGFPGRFQEGRKITASFKYGRERCGFRGHEPMAVWLINQIIPLRILTWVGLEQANNIPAILIKSLGHRVLDDLDHFVKQGDMDAVSDWTNRSGSKAAPFRPLAFGHGSLLDDFATAARRLLNEGRIKINTKDARIFLSRTHTILHVDEHVRSRRAPTLFRMVLDQCRSMADGAAGASGRYGGMDHDGYVKAIIDEMRAVEGGGWVVGDAESGEYRHVCRIVFSKGRIAGAETMGILNGCAIVVGNRSLWGDANPTAKHRVLEMRVCFSTVDDAKGSVPADEIGFLPIDRSALLPTTAVPMGANPISGGEDGVLEIGQCAAAIWKALDQLAPVAGDGPWHLRMKRRSQMVDHGGSMSVEQVVAVLGDAADRIRDLSASTADLARRAVETKAAERRVQVQPRQPATPAPARPAQQAQPARPAPRADPADPRPAKVPGATRYDDGSEEPAGADGQDPADGQQDDPEAFDDVPESPQDAEARHRNDVTVKMFELIAGAPMLPAHRGTGVPLAWRDGDQVAFRFPDAFVVHLAHIGEGLDADSVRETIGRVFKLQPIRDVLGVMCDAEGRWIRTLQWEGAPVEVVVTHLKERKIDPSTNPALREFSPPFGSATGMTIPPSGG